MTSFKSKSDSKSVMRKIFDGTTRTTEPSIASTKGYSESQIAEFANKFQIPEKLFTNMIKPFTIKFDKETITELEHHQSDTGAFMDAYHVMGLVVPEYRDKFVIERQFHTQLSEIPIKVDLKKIRNENLQETGIIRDLLDMMQPKGVNNILLPDKTLIDLDLMIQILKIASQTYPKTEDIQFFSCGEDLPLRIRVNKDYDFWIAPKVPEEGTEKSEAIKKAISLDTFLRFITLSKAEIEERKKVKTIIDIYKVRSQYRKIHKKFHDIIIPETIQAIEKNMPIIEDSLIKDIILFFSKINREIEKKLKKIEYGERGYRYKKIGEPIEKIEQIYNEYIKTVGTPLQEEILSSTEKLIDDAKQFYNTIQTKMNDIRINFIKGNYALIGEKLNRIQYPKLFSYITETRIEKEFRNMLVKEIPNINWEYYDPWIFYIPKEYVKQFETIVNQFSNEVDQERAKQQQ